MKRVLVITSNLSQASFRLRVAALLEPLLAAGFELEPKVRPRGWLARRALARISSGYDAVLLQRKLLDPGEARVLRRHARRILYDVDDAVMVEAGRAHRRSRWRTQRRFAATAAAVDLVVAGNEHLSEIFRARGCRVSVVPTTLSAGRYQVKSHAPTGTPRLVWIGSRSTLRYLRGCLPALEEAARLVPRLRLVTIADATVESAILPVEHVPWSAQDEAEALGRGDIGIAPMPDDPWTRGKCGFKIIQYMAAGLPVIASPVGANADLVRAGVNGLPAASPEDWPRAIALLAGDAGLRSRMGRAGRERVEKDFCIERAVAEWTRLLGE